MKITELEKIIKNAKITNVEDQPVIRVETGEKLGSTVDIQTDDEAEARKMTLQHFIDMPAGVRSFELEIEDE